MRWDKSQAIHRIGDWNVSHLIILVADHEPEVTFVCQLHGFDSEACSKNAIKCRRCAAALQMSEHAGARFFSGSFGDFARDTSPIPPRRNSPPSMSRLIC